MKDVPNKITATLKVIVTGEFYDDEASKETLRYCIEQDLEDAGFEVDVSLLKEQEAVEPINSYGTFRCGNCNYDLMAGFQFCPHCGRKVKWDA